jgi:hypothetical protein
MKVEKIGKEFEKNFWGINAKFKLEVLPAVAIS